MEKVTQKMILSDKNLVVFDFDGTLTTSDYPSSWQAVHEYFGTWVKFGQNALDQYLNGKISYKEFCRLDAMAWVDRSEQEYQKALDTIKIRDGTSEFIRFLKKKGCKLAIISMGLNDIVEKFAKEYQFDYWLANNIIRRNNKITGEIEINIDAREKGKILLLILEKFNLNQENSIAIGDGSADIELFEEAGFSIAVKPSSEKLIPKADLIMQTSSFKELIEYFKP